MRLSLTLQIKLSFECAVCEQLYLLPEAGARRVIARFLGGVKYAICNNCGLPVEDQTASYKERWNERAGKPKIYACVG